MTESIKYMDLSEFREAGYLQEVNRLFFHPRGLALEWHPNDDGTANLSGVWDYREDPEGMIFGDLSDEDSAAKAATVQAEYERHAAKRTELFGVIEQPIGSVVPPLDVASQS